MKTYLAKIIQNAFFCPEQNKYFNSVGIHDFVGTKLADGKEIYFDGGHFYFRSVGDFDLLEDGRIIDYCLTENNSWLSIRHKLLWGTRGEKGDQPLEWIPLAQCSLDHLKAIKRTQSQIKGTLTEKVVDYWIKVKERRAKKKK